nr:hypothetical protein [Mangrovicoccus ximenensis]
MSDAPEAEGLRPGETAVALEAPGDAALRFIGTIRTPWTDRADCPRQGRPDGSKVLYRSLTSDDGLNEESKHREHSQSSVLELLHLQLSECLWVGSQTQWVEHFLRLCSLQRLPSK